jgi:hypothetical protein
MVKDRSCTVADGKSDICQLQPLIRSRREDRE